MLRLLLISFLTCTTFISWAAISIYSYSHKRNEIHSDVAVVLGAAVVRDQPSPVFRERINHAITLYRQGKVRYLIFTGGLGKGKAYTESEVAKNYALANGVPGKDIYLDTVSKITYENLFQAKRLIEANKFKSALIVSDPLHMRRAMTMAKDLGLIANSAPTPTSRYQSWSVKKGFLAREVYFYLSYLLRR